MSLAGKRSLKESLRSLFKPSEQASSIPVSGQQALPKGKPVIPILPQTVRRLDKLVSKWVEGKGYRMPDRTIEDAARRIGTDSATLYRYFLSRGEDFRTFRSRLRLEDAKAMLLEDRETSACIYSSTGLVPSMEQATTEPEAFSGLPSSIYSEGLGTSESPSAPISNTPISFVDPKRFFTLRRMRYEALRSPSK